MVCDSYMLLIYTFRQKWSHSVLLPVCFTQHCIIQVFHKCSYAFNILWMITSHSIIWMYQHWLNQSIWILPNPISHQDPTLQKSGRRESLHLADAIRSTEVVPQILFWGSWCLSMILIGSDNITPSNNKWLTFIQHCRPGLSTLQILSHLIFITTLWGKLRLKERERNLCQVT